jgi:hypothetical protein
MSRPDWDRPGVWCWPTRSNHPMRHPDGGLIQYLRTNMYKLQIYLSLYVCLISNFFFLHINLILFFDDWYKQKSSCAKFVCYIENGNEQKARLVKQLVTNFLKSFIA